MGATELSFYMLISIISMAICMAIIPVMMRLAPAIGMVDKPGKRKVHKAAIPRSGGVGIVIGLLVPLITWLDLDRFSLSLILGCLILLIFGAWDDSRDIRPIFKFAGQLIASITVVYYGDLYVFQFPFMGLQELPQYIGKPFTVIAFIGMINALNLSDGLDGLAGGEALISLAAILYLAFLFDGTIVMTITAATIGGIFGFLRFNSHPARIFMGDAGSQTLGLILGVMVVYLSQQLNPVVSPVVALMLLGLPVMDSLVVFYMRARRGDSLVVPAKDHLHHRLLALGLYHYESVMVIYSIQSLLVIVAVLMPYESDLLLISIYLGISIVIYSLIVIAEKRNWRAHSRSLRSPQFLSDLIAQHQIILTLPVRVIEAGLSVLLIGSVLMATSVPVDIGYSSFILMILLVLVIVTGWFGIGLFRLIVFVSAGTAVFLISEYPPDWLLEQIYLVYAFNALMILAAFIVARLNLSNQFNITPLDYLVIIFALAVAGAPGVDVESSSITWMVIQMIILFYSAELLMQTLQGCRNRFSGIILTSLVIIAARAIS
jgi:UDP-GlcNAc:undecaprenyl-phosphate GlcNAc-1-phosphate transferase